MLGNRDKTRQMIEISEIVGLDGPFIHQGPFPAFDHCGYQIAVTMLLSSLRKGRNNPTHLQISTIRKMVATYGNQTRASPQSTSKTLALVDDSGRYRRMVTDPCASMWFRRFQEGCTKRMGEDWRPNKALDLPLYLKLLENLDGKIEQADSPIEENRWTVAHAFMVVSYVVSLRGSEGLLLDLEGLNNFLKETMTDPTFGEYVYICLRGQVKGENNVRSHLLPSVAVTRSGVRVKDSLTRLIQLKQRQGFEEGPAVSSTQGIVLTTQAINDCLIEALEDIYKETPELFPKTLKNIEELQSDYQVYRSLRRTSDAVAIEEKVSAVDIDVVNRWSEVEKAKGKRPNRPMKHHYADITMLLKPFLRYTSVH